MIRRAKLNILLTISMVVLLTSFTAVFASEVSWMPGVSGPNDWSIDTNTPTTFNLVHFSGPTAVFGNECKAEQSIGGTPTLSINTVNKTVELWIQPPPPQSCGTEYVPVCGLEGSFGPLEAGEWLFFGNDPNATFSIPFQVSGPVVHHVDDNAPNDPGPGDPNVSDPLEDGTDAHPFDTIQEAIDVAQDGHAVLVWPGLYLDTDPLNDDYIIYSGENIILTSVDPTDWNVVESTIIRGYVQFLGTEDANCILTGFSIKDPYDGAIYGNGSGATISHCIISGNAPDGGIAIMECDGTISNCAITDNTNCGGCGQLFPVIYDCGGLIKNCTIANNASGIYIFSGKLLTMQNCIIYNNGGSQIEVLSGSALDISYCDLQNGFGGIAGNGTVNRGPGNIDADPCFVNIANKDYHLRSEGWRWSKDLIHGSHWTYDSVTSRCIDAGNPGSPLGDELLMMPDDPNHDWGVNLRINMGAFGGTAQASMPPYDWALLGDLNNDGIIDYVDLEEQIGDWLTTANEQPGDLNRDGTVNMLDFAMLADDWLQMTTWAQ